MSWIDSIKAALSRSNPQGADPNFSAGMQFWTPGQPVWTDKDYRSFVRSGYRKNPTVYACINKITGAAAGINWKLYTDRDCKNTIDTHPLLDLWRKPNPSMPGSGSFIEQSFGFWHMSGNNYIYAFRPNPNDPPLALWTLRPDKMKAVASANGIQGYVYGYESQDPITYEAPEILHMKFPGYDNDIYGLSPVEVASYMSDQQNEAMGWNTSLMQNAGRPASVFTSKSFLTVEQREQIKAELRKKYSGKRNAGMPLVLEADMTWQAMSLTPMELDFLKSYEANTRGIAAIFDIAPELIGDSAGKTFANVAEARQALYLENVLPKLDRMSDYLNTWLVPMYPDLTRSGAYFTYDKEDIEALQALYQQQKDAIHNRVRQDWLNGIIMLDEARDALGMKKAKYGKIYRIGLVLVSEDSLEDYADQSLTEPAVPPMGIPEPLNVPGADPNAPQLPAPGNTTNNQQPPTKKPAKPAKDPVQPVASAKSMDKDGVYQPDDLKEQIAALIAKGVKYITWTVDKNPCDICQLNDAQTVELGDEFWSGHILPPAHPNCGCDVVPATHKAIARHLETKLVEGYKEYKRYASVTSRASDRLDTVTASATLDTGKNGPPVRLRTVQIQMEEVQERTPDDRSALTIEAPDYSTFINKYD